MISRQQWPVTKSCPCELPAQNNDYYHGLLGVRNNSGMIIALAAALQRAEFLLHDILAGLITRAQAKTETARARLPCKPAIQ